jgi:hypothetical protein
MLRSLVWLATFALFAAGVAMAQDVISAKAGLVYSVFGQVSVVSSGRLGAAPYRQLNQGDILFSEAGRAEVLLNPGTVLRIGNMTRIRMDRVDLTDTRVSIEAGSAVVTVNQLPKLARVEIQIGGAVVAVKGDGVYRFDGDPSPPRLRVFSGQAESNREEGTHREAVVKRGQIVQFQDSRVSKFDLKDADAFQQWAEARGTPPPPPALLPIKCYSMPTKMAELSDWMRDCMHVGQVTDLPAHTKSTDP